MFSKLEESSIGENITEAVSEYIPDELKPDFIQSMLERLKGYVPTLISAAVLLIIGLIVKGIIISIVRKALGKSKLDKTVHSFITSSVNIIITALVLIITLSTLGIPMTSIIAVVSAAGLAVGLALQGSLSNVAGGFIILLSKPFKHGDYISVDGVEGTVDNITVLKTTIITIDNKTVHLPNGKVSEGTIVNFTGVPKRRVDHIFNVSYENDTEKVLEVIRKTVSADEKVDKTPAPEVRVNALKENSVEIVCKLWTDTAQYWNVYYDSLENIKKAFDKEGIRTAYTNIRVHKD